MRFNFQKQAKALLVIFLVFFLFVLPSEASVKSKVVDEEGNPIIGATIVSNIAQTGAVSAVDGSFEIKSDETITQITVSSIGFKSRMISVENLPDKIVLEKKYYRSKDITVTSDRAELGIDPVAFENIPSDDIERDYTVGEFPLLLSSTPNVHSFADGGAPLGYSYTRIRGFDDKRIVTYINGVPLNDPEDHATYFVDLPDFAANVSDIQVQRGVGNSMYGDGSFGGSINVVTSAFETKRSASVTYGYGGITQDGKINSDIYKQSVEYNSGLIDGRWVFGGRFSKQKTGGYRHNSWYDGWSYYFSVGRLDPNMTTELYVYGGPIRMHLSYYGSPRTDIDSDRLYNPLSYTNETDNFNQPHYHLHNRYRLNDKVTINNTLYYIRGKGYYEQYKSGSDYSDYSLTAFSDSSEGDLVRQQHVEKNQYGWNGSIEMKHDRGDFSFGGSLFYFESDHWGQVVWAQYLNSDFNDPRFKYYQYFGEKLVGSIFAREHYKLNEKFSVQAGLQLRYQKYKLDQVPFGPYVGYDYNLDWVFLSPRFGLNYQLDEKTSTYFNFSIASRAPSDVAIYDANDPSTVPSLDENGDPTAKSERVYDFELGTNYRSEKTEGSINFFWMEFKDEIVPYGGINESGILFTTNAKRSVHSGIEISAAFMPADGFKFEGNFAYNYNRIKDYIDTLEVYSNDWSTVRDTVIDFKDKTIPAFPDYLANLMVEYQKRNFRSNISLRLIGEQFPELFNYDSLKIDAAAVVNYSASYSFENFVQNSNLVIRFRVDNLFNKKYETSGYGWAYGHDDSGGAAQMIYEAEYYVAPERTIYGELKLEFF